MRYLKTFIKTLLFSTLLFHVVGCAGIEPYDPPDYREDPPVQGVLTGEEGEFVIYRKTDGAKQPDKSGTKSD